MISVVRNMVISIELIGAQRIIAKIDNIAMPITEKTKAGNALDFIKTKYPELSLDQDSLIITVNHEAASRERTLRANDTVCFIPCIGGG
jgi:molybdopterin converting factor small subunit